MIGIGLNVDTALDELADELRETASSLRIASGGPVDREAALDALLERLAAWIARLGDPARVVEAFRERDALQGQRIAWSSGQARQEGEARGIDDDGALVVFTDAGERVRLDAGEVHLERRRRSARRSGRFGVLDGRGVGRVGAVRARGLHLQLGQLPPGEARPPSRPRRSSRPWHGGPRRGGRCAACACACPSGSSAPARAPGPTACAPCGSARRAAPPRPPGVWPTAAASSAAASRRSCLRAAWTSRRALRPWAGPDELTSSPSSRFVSGQRCTAYSSCTSREYSASRHSHACAWSRRPMRRSASACSSVRAPSRRSSRDHVPMISIACVEALRVAAHGDLRERALAQLRVAVALHAAEQEPAAQLAVGVVVQRGLRAAPAVGGHARAGERGPRMLLVREAGTRPRSATARARRRAGAARARPSPARSAARRAAGGRGRGAPGRRRSRRRGRRRGRAACAASRSARRASSPGGRSRSRCPPPCRDGDA